MIVPADGINAAIKSGNFGAFLLAAHSAKPTPVCTALEVAAHPQCR